TRAAAAADEAAAHAGEAAQAATQSAAHAAEATAASQLAVSAATQAVEVEKLARDADAARLAEATEQGVADAQEAVAADAAARAAGGETPGWDRNVRWDTAEDARVPAATRTLLQEATAPGASTQVVLAKGRQAALALATTGGEWTKAAAAEALAGDEVALRSWLTVGRTQAAGQDDRARVWHLVDTLPDGQERTAARASLDGDDAAVATFLKTRAYPRKIVDDRLALSRILNSNPGPALYAATQKALAGTAQQAHEFLRDGQHVARAADQRVEITRVMDAGGAEVKAAAQVALAGPPSYGTDFLAVGQFQAAQRDKEQAAHVQAVRALVQQAQEYAQKALADAAEARRVAAVAKGAAAEAAAAANQAAAAANQAATYAAQATQSAAAAKASADQAAQSAQTAKDAAAKAQVSANNAARSALTASAASERAEASAAAAQAAKSSARASAVAAGRDAVAANQAALEAATTYSVRLKQQEVADRNATPGSGPDGTSSADWAHRYENCLNPLDKPAQRPECQEAYREIVGLITDPEKCSRPLSRDALGCQMASAFWKDLTELAEEDPELLASMGLDAFQLLLGLCGLAPGFGEACDGVDAIISGFRGDWLGAGLSIAAMIPVFGWLPGGARIGADATQLVRALDKVEDVLAARRAANAGTHLSDEYLDLALKHVTDSGDTVLGRFPQYIDKAQARGASYFDIGGAWDDVIARGDDPWSLNVAFLDDRIAAGDRMLLSVPKQDVLPGTYLSKEIQYLLDHGYVWVNQWSLVPRG
ncbi:ALF repeat-containing protein, partial [Cellulomonas algicola]|uniref:ALF repeat-containing protein n=1 Tax=Cellulomonas algicola TaxID=2071633 RepID=UPI00190F4567